MCECVYLSGCACVCNCGYIILRLNSAVSRATFRDPEVPEAHRTPGAPPKDLAACLPAFVSEGKYTDIQVGDRAQKSCQGLSRRVQVSLLVEDL